ncbi:MAG: hypothetical protein JHD17_03770 [Acidimicrobiia bacterium]|jgi:hypothetical protein|nr:hypothetical protein [Acidimicrobiia bacterium]MCX6505045.1 hypothetical protein [Actinomycetota bacterium]GDX29619.1 hypothetical protein LBMAG14_00950 [Actinomycetes bacterium]MSO18153.1 hypothetical protein [Acidimicrobiia bacterium]MSV40454.1 hypothetical protein [Actinomycetota bacterium]
MGSSGMKKRRKPQQPAHLPKVGAHDEAREEQRLERSAVLDVMGLGGRGRMVGIVVGVVGVALLVLAVVSLIGLD